MDLVSVENGKKGGRPVCDPNIRFEIPKVAFVILTENQYNALLDKYGCKIVSKALEIFDKWLCTSPIGVRYLGKNNYAHFRSDGWVINTARQKFKKT